MRHNSVGMNMLLRRETCTHNETAARERHGGGNYRVAKPALLVAPLIRPTHSGGACRRYPCVCFRHLHDLERDLPSLRR